MGFDPVHGMNVIVLGDDPRIFTAVADRLIGTGIATLQLAGIPELLVTDPAILATAEVLYAPGFFPINAAVLKRLPHLLGLVSPFTGVEGFDRDAANAQGVLIGSGQIDENVDSMAEATLLMLLAAAYRLPEATAAMAGGAWPRTEARGRMVKTMTVGLVGYGRIAQALAARLVPFGCPLLVYAPRLRAPLPPDARSVPLEQLAEESDAVVALASLGPDSRHLIDAALISRMKPSAIIVNTARGALVDEAALNQAVLDGRLSGVALDVFEQEPLPAEAVVRTLPHAILTPHTIGHTRETIAALPLHAYDNVRRLLEGKPPVLLVNPEALPLWRSRTTNRP